MHFFIAMLQSEIQTILNFSTQCVKNQLKYNVINASCLRYQLEIYMKKYIVAELFF